MFKDLFSGRKESPTKRPQSPPRAPSDNPPPSTEQIPLPGMRPLNFELPRVLGRPSALIIVDECIAHLKLLAAFADLRDTISQSDGLFGLYEADHFHIQTPEEQKTKITALVREKRWGVYVARAVSRFEKWFFTLPMDGPGECQGATTIDDVTSNPEYKNFPQWKNMVIWTMDVLPPLDVLMVWHAYMLNPRDYLEDCLRLGKMSVWTAGMPWEVVNSSIDSSSFDYRPGDGARERFESKTSCSWDNLHDSPYKIVACPACQTNLQVPWVQERPQLGSIKAPFENCTGYADRGFQIICARCYFKFDHERLRVVKFLNDMEKLANLKIPMPGTILSLKGVPQTPVRAKHSVLFPSKLILNCLQNKLRAALNFRENPGASVSDIRDLIEQALKSPRTRSTANGSISGQLTREEKIPVRRMMSRYWDNSSPFALDLIGAVIRQGVFIGKMDDIDWLHSPTLDFTMERIIKKYRRFFRILHSNTEVVAVPTLDVDLAWHTHQLSPQRYFTYSVTMTPGKFINHDDKIESSKLSDGFERTAKAYEAAYGEIYSQCTCWYCEAIRESNGSNGRFSSNRENAIAFHDQPDIPSDPTKSPHISAHNSIDTRFRGSRDISLLDPTALKLQYAHQRATRRWEKRNKKKISLDTDNDTGAASRAYGAMAMVYGCPVFVPLYLPYGPDPSINCEMYSCNPLCIPIEEGEHADCVSGTCALDAVLGACEAGCDGGGCSSCGSGGCGGGGGGGGCGGGGGGC
ncbi:hypothetical protein D8B26_003860 [Coccidioides posadasii str. Silveira]|uniref:Uncharacterized protein n=2 Tax=Coccidioides posadasii TaxID=199306 RepID=E9D963_COCPS|nr:hypothetical protein CPC735_072590 [Coccidioides posadasii C735 delta SOWgp]EER29577.1 hypothetical protein CPC735_072590 [Coccidioides posadasii C735 delta SOWgp]EFW17097.1 conserved hypothetical protein [Coccidioides posadasii str. Silveira]QVM09196.1 hypothetical protein D8B26_003860 [Coccidioides posadasii str. Silveira]|eukprot:XP_003071722.1 hypothetical protein CPC735_072590 [Coccidioides posadasii C735 delta SOWgp]